jgi:hypothetical protein
MLTIGQPLAELLRAISLLTKGLHYEPLETGVRLPTARGLQNEETEMSSTNRTLPVQDKHQPEARHMVMKWVTVTDTIGNRRPQMRWWVVG